MTILEKVKQYYHSNSTDLNSFLEETFFLETTREYPNCVVIKFVLHKLFGEVSVWQRSSAWVFLPAWQLSIHSIMNTRQQAILCLRGQRSNDKQAPQRLGPFHAASLFSLRIVYRGTSPTKNLAAYQAHFQNGYLKIPRWRKNPFHWLHINYISGCHRTRAPIAHSHF